MTESQANGGPPPRGPVQNGPVQNDPAQDGPAQNGDVRNGAVVACLTLCALGGSFVAALGTPLIPTVSEKLDVSLDSAQWTLTIALLVGAVGTPLISRLADGGRRRRILTVTLVLTVLGAIIGALAPNFGWLLAGRAMQGAGYAIAPVAIGIVRELLTGAAMRRAVATLSVTIAVGVGIGNPITGAFVTFLNFRAAFWFAGAFGVLSLIWMRMTVPEPPVAGARVRIDWPGAFLLSIGLGGLLVAISQGETWGWGSTKVLGLGVGGIVVIAVWALVEIRLRSPLVDLRLAALPSVIGANVATLFLGMAMFGGSSLTVRLVQTPTSTGYGLGANTFVGAMLLFAFSCGSLASQFALKSLTARLGLRRLLPFAAILLGCAWLTIAFVHGAIWQIALVMSVAGIGMGISFATLPLLITSAVPADRTASANGLNTVIRLIGGTLGSAGSAAVLTANTPAGATYPHEIGYTVTGILAAAICWLSATAGWALIRGAERTDDAGEREDDLLAESAAPSAPDVPTPPDLPAQDVLERFDSPTDRARR
jgi:predicted MFS family arabinose efflux permease